MTELIVGTKKGLFALSGEPGAEFEVTARAFAGEPVDYAMRDGRSGRVIAAVTSPFYGPKLWHTADPAGEWTQAEGVALPEGGDAALERIWVVVPGEDEGTLYAGGDPGVLFESRDAGATWELNRALWEHPTRGSWQPGGGGLCLHSIVPWPGEPDRLAVAVSAAGVWLTEDRGRSWRQGNDGLVARYLPEAPSEDEEVGLCVHRLQRSPARPERVFMQFHGGVYRSDDAGASWTEVGAGLPSDFGFPLVLDPADPDSAYVIPLTADTDRVTPEGRVRVYETRDAGGDVVAPRRRPAPERRLPHRPAPGVRRRGGRTGPRAVLRRHLRRGVRLRRRRRDVGHRRLAPAPGLLRRGEPVSDGATSPAARFLALHRAGEPLLLPNPWDAGSARLLASLGFEALATTSSGFAATLGRLDGGVTRDEALAHAAGIVAATDLPVSADLENGFADDPAGVADTIALARDAGLAGGSVEDFAGRADEPIYELGRAAERVAAAAEAAHAGAAGLVLTARAENFLRGRPDLADTIARLQAYQEAGADVLYAPGLVDLADIRRVVAEVDRPVNVLALPAAPPVAELAAAGVSRISVGGAFAFAGLGAVIEAARELREDGTYGFWERAAAGAEAARRAFRAA